MDGKTGLSYWLLIVASLRLLSVFLGIFNPSSFKTALIDRQPHLVTPLFGRLFAAWTTVTCCLCVSLSFDIANRSLYAVTLSSFAVAIIFFLSELFIFRTVSLKGALSPLIIATVSSTWMALGWSEYTQGGF
ncbi:MAG: hypothetical protein WDW38_010774 [Sanguina aurantia]